VVAAFAANAAGGASAVIKFTCRVTRSAASAGSRSGPENAAAPAPQPDPVPSDAEDCDKVAQALGDIVIENNKELRAEHAVALAERDNKLAELAAENLELKSLLGDALARFAKLAAEFETLRRDWQADKRETQIRNQAIIERSGRVAELQRENAEARTALEQRRLDQMLTERDARLDALETRLGMLLNFIGGDLPRGWGRDGT